ncbi:MAG: hypothetical protein H6Q85_1824 [candidate division NC10 bacterium]|jgi:hypothetical protein|nr:hypothetical protein [candidate division NC10 bacterium]
MNTQVQPVPKSVVAAICLALLAILFGFTLGGAFGAVEDSIVKYLDDSGTAVLQTVYKGDVAAKDAVVKKSWVYLQRAHLHGGAIGTAALGAILTLVIMCRLGLVAKLSALAFGGGALTYSLFWLFAGLTAPGLGSTGVAKEALSFMAIPGAGLCILGLAGTIYSVVKDCFLASTEA